MLITCVLGICLYLPPEFQTFSADSIFHIGDIYSHFIRQSRLSPSQKGAALRFFIVPGMRKDSVEKLLGKADVIESHGLITHSYDVYSYIDYGFSVTFDSNGKVWK